MGRCSKEDLLRELDECYTILGLGALCEYKNNGVVVEVRKADTGFLFDRELILSDGTSVVAWV